MFVGGHWECRPFPDAYTSATDERYAVNAVDVPGVSAVVLSTMCFELIITLYIMCSLSLHPVHL